MMVKALCYNKGNGRVQLHNVTVGANVHNNFSKHGFWHEFVCLGLSEEEYDE